MSQSDIFEPFEQLITLRVLGRPLKVPERNSILRGFQFLDLEGISDGEFCWNGECLNCQVTIGSGGREKPVMACRTYAADGMEILKISDEIRRAAADLLGEYETTSE
ncbi:MAG: (2Fe-2S)-binding protein [Chloracidobacterium sp.]|nr:(2Fe-2S)-binding protein [Chloracidobacterium sp.]